MGYDNQFINGTTKIWHTFLSGYRHRIAGIQKEKNPYKKVFLSGNIDSIEWDNGWDMANNDLKGRTFPLKRNTYERTTSEIS